MNESQHVSKFAIFFLELLPVIVLLCFFFAFASVNQVLSNCVTMYMCRPR